MRFNIEVQPHDMQRDELPVWVKAQIADQLPNAIEREQASIANQEARLRQRRSIVSQWKDVMTYDVARLAEPKVE